MAKLKTNCVLCCETTRTQRGSNSKRVRDQALLTEWTESCVSTLCQILELDPGSSQAMLQGNATFCSECLQLLRDMDFLVKNIAQFQKRLSSLKVHIKCILATNAQQLENESNTYAKTVKRIAKASLSLAKLRSRSGLSSSIKDSEDSDKESGGAGDLNDDEHVLSDTSFSEVRAPHRGRRSCRSTYSRIHMKEDPTSETKVEAEVESDLEEEDNYSNDPDFSSGQEDDAVEPAVSRKPKSDLKVKKKVGRPKGSKPPPPKKKLWCSYPNCSAYFLKDWAMQAHVARDHEGNLTPHNCPQCDLTFHSRSALHTHCEAFHGIPIVRYPCSKCNKAFRQQFTLKRHIAHMHPEGPVRPKCSVCFKTFEVEEEVKGHEQLHHALRTTVNPFTCVLCDVPCVGILSLQSHVLKEHDDTSCKCTVPGCEKVFKSSYSLKCHVKTKHAVRDKPHLKCPQCAHRATAPSALKKHMFTHWDKHPFQCDSCGKTFKYNSTLNRHKALEHNTAAEVFCCTLCPKTFKQKGSLDGHYAHHSTARSFLCELCPLSFKTLQNLRTHNKVHAPNQTAKPVLGLRLPRKPRLPPVLDLGREADPAIEAMEQNGEDIPSPKQEIVGEGTSLFPINNYDTKMEIEIDFSEVETPCIYAP